MFASVSALIFSSVPNSHALSLPGTFKTLAISSTLAKPGIVIFDPTSQSEIYSNLADVPRAPASVLKLISASTALNVFGPDKVFKTSINSTDDPNTFLLSGEYDPWLTTSSRGAQKYHRAVSTKLISAISRNLEDYPRLTIKFNGLFEADVRNLRKFYGKKIKFERTSQVPAVEGEELNKIAEILSPPLSDIVGFTLLWSDNVLADRLARNAAVELGYSRDAIGINSAFNTVLKSLEVNSVGLHVIDGSGLSHDNRVSARTIAELLWKIRIEPKFQAIYDGLPVAGESGTLRKRFHDFGSTAKGLVKAKSGWINSTVSLAGYVDAGDGEYVFAVIANHVNPTEKSRDRARKIIDKMLATIAKPIELA
jgi:D-alanyl-D-alanine carboxypeptidase/D-alanyl-D-alanine-endopeptidase (penicillin-binding protein 4)